jgi:ornithine cyclodeaminase
MTAIGARHLARKGALVLGHVGARGTAFANVTLLDRVLGLDEIRVTSARPESRAAFGEQLERALGKPVRVLDSIEETVRGADVVVEATRLPAPEPILKTEWIAPAAFVVPYGTMSAVELSLTSIMDKIFVDDWGQCRSGRFGALRAHVEQGLVTEDTIAGELADVVAGSRPGREREDERILLWHRGLATTDIALGQAILDRAVDADVGTLLPYR